ncbi:spore germination protein GerPC [Paenibacillus eucommiae]|uniref:Spore germination protein PC n=1 Tax=Paenibacillus eucommiae TaxID=1355755 RepID=A0ABS4IXT8_9BACL|nr:spore germination protein GerPC [Paenibacillus eucommiae]MBP1992387.1 spore germination protein PC [Paenibacillus eucommiae]
MSCQQVFQQVYAHLSSQAKRIEKLEQTVIKLQAEIDASKGQKKFHIDKIEYKFDQLKVERLDGSLSIGINPSSFDDVEDFTVNGSPLNSKVMPPNPMCNLKDDISGSINDYLSQDAKDDINAMENKYQYPIDESYKQLILDDIRNQVEPRIKQYIDQYRSAGFKEPLDAIRENIIDQTKNDIRTAMNAYISNLTETDGEQP